MNNSFSTAASLGHYQTKPIFTTLVSLLLVFIPYVVVWILCWEFGSEPHTLISMPTFIQVDGFKSISWQIWTIVFSLFGFCLLLPWILKLLTLNHINIDCSPFIYGTASFCVMIFITWLIPLNDSRLSSLYVIGRIIISVVVAAIVFVITNKLINYILSNSNIGDSIAIELKNKQVAEDMRHQELKNMKKNKSKEKEFVELEVKKKKDKTNTKKD